MIAIIADDFTGAAELAGISLRYGLTVELCLLEVNYVNADVLIVCTDSRSVNEAAAKKITEDVVNEIFKLKPTFIYKKIDSVLRGYVLAELKIQMNQTGFEKAFVLPSNPSLGRTIYNGEYFIDGIKINETAFAKDPEFPMQHSSVVKMIGSDDVKILKLKDVLPLKDIVIGEATSVIDTAAWAEKIDEHWMLAGAGDFYDAILRKQFNLCEPQKIELQLPHIYVSGTAFDNRKKQIKQIEHKHECVAYLSDKILENTADEIWDKQVAEIIKSKKKLVIAIDKSSKDPVLLRATMAKVIVEIMQRENIKEIFIEGGSTAAAVLQELNIKKLMPVNELERGVVRVKAFTSFEERLGEGGLYITVKPGSYDLPKEILELYL
jgi:D-threonate/D-erythronate kinase